MVNILNAPSPLAANNDSSPVQIDGRIVGGSQAAIQYFPWQVSVTYYRTHRCGGTLISPLHVLSAAHCTFRAQRAAIGIRAGSGARNDGGQTRTVHSIAEYPGYSHRANDFDICVIRMSSALPLGAAVQPIALADRGAVLAPGMAATISGWGDTQETPGHVPHTLQFAAVPIVDRTVCTAAYARHARITAQMICAGFEGIGGRDACQGDSGGPLVVAGRLHGVVSFGIGCARPNFPGVYTSVAAYRQWIDSVVAQK